MKTPLKILVIGAGDRGSRYADLILEHHAQEAQVVGVAEPRDSWRNNLAKKHRVPAERCFRDWQSPLQQTRFADAVIIYPDQLHAAPAIAYARAGYHILLEKPMAPTAKECAKIVAAVKNAEVHLAVCHVLRYTRYTAKMKTLIADGAIGDPVSLQHLEPVGYAHQAHSFVRGNWGNSGRSCFMLLSKSCHDLDWMSYIMGAPIKRVSSFGSRKHFHAQAAPLTATDRCLDCPVENACPYSARKIYLEPLAQGHQGWPVNIITDNLTAAGVEQALREGPYGRCVYRCDNDVVDHQVVNLEFAGGSSGVFTMTAFTRMLQHRQTRVFGTHGELLGDGQSIQHYDFLRGTRQVHDDLADGEIIEGHAGADAAMIRSFIEALSNHDPAALLSGPDETLTTHLAVFAAETARLQGTVEQVQQKGAVLNSCNP